MGGAIKKDKLFYFVTYEGQRYTAGQALAASTPVTCAGGSAGCLDTKVNDTGKSIIDACNSVNNAHIANSANLPVTPLSALISGLTFSTSPNSCAIRPPNYTPGASESFFPTNNGALVTSTNNAVLNLQSVNQQDNGVAKIDYHINDQNQITGMYFRGQGGGIWADSAAELRHPGDYEFPLDVQLVRLHPDGFWCLVLYPQFKPW